MTTAASQFYVSNKPVNPVAGSQGRLSSILRYITSDKTSKISTSGYTRTAPGHIFSAPRWEELKRSIATGTMAGELPILPITATKLALQFQLPVLTSLEPEFNCQSGRWKSPGGKPRLTQYSYTNYNSSHYYYAIGTHDFCTSQYGNENDRDDSWRGVERLSDGSWRINVKDGSETAMCLDW